MALPKGVKSQVDYTKLYMSNELEGDVLLELELPKFTKTDNPGFKKQKVHVGNPISQYRKDYRRTFQRFRQDELSKP